MKRSSWMLAAVAVLAFPASARTQSWVFYPDGSVGLDTHYSTSGKFACRITSVVVYPDYSCAASGNTLTLRSGTATLDVSFTGITSAPIVIRNVSALFPVGTFTSVLGGTGDFLFPLSPNNDAGALFTFAIGGAVARFWGAGGKSINGTLTPDYFGISVQFPDPLPGYSYGAIASPAGPLTITAENGPTVVEARIGLIPEPSTALLVGTGLILVALGTRGRHASISFIAHRDPRTS